MLWKQRAGRGWGVCNGIDTRNPIRKTILCFVSVCELIKNPAINVYKQLCMCYIKQNSISNHQNPFMNETWLSFNYLKLHVHNSLPILQYVLLYNALSADKCIQLIMPLQFPFLPRSWSRAMIGLYCRGKRFALSTVTMTFIHFETWTLPSSYWMA